MMAKQQPQQPTGPAPTGMTLQKAGRLRRAGRVAVNVGRKTELIGEPKEPGDIRYSDAAIAAIVAASSAVFTATRPTTGAQVGWGTVWSAIGMVMAAEGRTPLLRMGGLGLLGANAAFLALRAIHPNLKPQQTTSQQARAPGGYMG